MKAISAEVFRNAPKGSNGFRRGVWVLTLENGEKTEFFSSVSHDISLDDQEEILLLRFNGRLKESA